VVINEYVRSDRPQGFHDLGSVPERGDFGRGWSDQPFPM